MESISLFIKPYISLTKDKIIKKIKELEFSKIEFPVRERLLINPENCEVELPKLKDYFLNEGIEISSITSSIDERIFSAMYRANISTLRIMLPMRSSESYYESEMRFLEELKLGAEYCEKYNVKIVIQPHNGRFIANLFELKNLIEKCKSKYIKAIWDIGHSGLAGEIPSKSADIIFNHLEMVNFKSAYYKKINNKDGTLSYKPYYTVGKESPLNWMECINILREKGYKGTYCIHAEYTDPLDISKYTQEYNTDVFLKEDLNYLKSIF